MLTAKRLDEPVVEAPSSRNRDVHRVSIPVTEVPAEDEEVLL